MREKILCYNDVNGNVTVLESSGETVQNVHADTADLNDWPNEFQGAFEKSGLMIWEGDVITDGVIVSITGSFRDLNEDEWNLLQQKRCVFPELE